MSESPAVPRSSTRRTRRTATAMVASGAMLVSTALALLPGTAGASSHREAPLIAETPAYDNTDVYAFLSPTKKDTVVFVSNWFGLQEPNGGPTFYPWADDARYNIKIDSDGDAKPDVTYRYEFTTEDLRDDNNTFLYNNGPIETLDDENLLFKQFWTLTKITDKGEEVVAEGQAAPSNTGPTSVPSYADLIDDATYDVEGGGQTYVGQTEDPFFLDLRVFDLLYGTDLSEVGQDTLAGYNVNTTVLEVPLDQVALNGDSAANPVIGIWSTTDRRSLVEYGVGTKETSGDFQQVSRLGNPLVNEVVFDIGLKDAFNSIPPSVDATVPEAVDRVLDPEVPKLIEAIYGIPAPETPRYDLFEIFLTGIASTAPVPEGANLGPDLNSQVLNADVDPKNFVPSEMLRLNMAVPVTAEPNRLGVLGGDLQGFPNGRRLSDDVVDIGIQALEGAVRSGEIVEALAAGDAVDANDKEFSDEFPYVLPANNQNVNDPANTQTGVAAGGEGDEAADSGAESSGGPLGFLMDMLPGVATGLAGMVLIGAGSVRHLRQK